MIRALLRRQALAWTSMNIKDCAKYFGFFIGRLAGGSQWNGALEKFNGRCLDLKASEQPMSLSIRQFNCRAVPTLGYLPQLVPPPQNMTRVELSAILQLLNLAGNSTTCDVAFRLQDFLDVSPIRPSVAGGFHD